MARVWAWIIWKEYKLDGRRFDLMGLHDLATMQAVECTVHAVNPCAILYGEGWNMGATINGSAQANQGNISALHPSCDAVNNINWSVLREENREYAAMCYYKGLIEMRKHFPVFTNRDAEIVRIEETKNGILAVDFDDGKDGRALALLNPHDTGLPYPLEGEWNLVATGERAGAAVLAREQGCVTVEAISARVYVNDPLVR